ncbi:MAG: PqqD family protein [Bacteroidales bacterium]
MKLKENLTIRKIGDDYMMVSHSGTELDYTRVIGLNHSAAFLVQQVQQNEFTKQEWVNMLVDKYNVEREVAERDVEALIDKLNKEKLIDE